MSFLKNFKKGSDLLLLNTLYTRPHRKEDKSYGDDKLYIIYKDIGTSKKYLEVINEPKIDIYFAKEGVEYEVNQPYIKKDLVERHHVPYKDVTKYIANHAGKEYVNYFWKCLRERKIRATKNLHKYRYVFSSDIDVEDFYRIEFMKNYTTSKVKLEKSFLDIEVDIRERANTSVDYLIENPDSPINVVSLVHAHLNTCYTFILRNPENPQIQELEDNIDDFKAEVEKEYQYLIDKIYNNTTSKMKYNIIFYDDEIDLITDIFNNINIIKPDFVLLWNMGFDIRYIMNRLEYLGYDPSSIICHPDFEDKKCFYRKDTRHFKIAEKDDYFMCSSYTTYTDQMINYAKVNKGKKELPSVKLDYIGELEVGEKKVNYDDEGGSIAEFPWVNFRKFIKYSIKDVLIPAAIESKTEYLDLIYTRSYESGTRYNKIFRQSIFLKNYAHIVYPQLGYILGNNNNIDYGYMYEEYEEEDEESEEKFAGAIVSVPSNNDFMGEIINGIRSKFIYRNVIDFDYSRLYPSIRDSHNIEITSQVGRVIIEQEISDLENPYEYEKYDRGGNFLDDLQVGNLNVLGYKWFGLPSIEDILDDLESELITEEVPNTYIDTFVNPLVDINMKGFVLEYNGANIVKGFNLDVFNDFFKAQNEVKGFKLSVKDVDVEC